MENKLATESEIVIIGCFHSSPRIPGGRSHKTMSFKKLMTWKSPQMCVYMTHMLIEKAEDQYLMLNYSHRKDGLKRISIFPFMLMFLHNVCVCVCYNQWEKVTETGKCFAFKK